MKSIINLIVPIVALLIFTNCTAQIPHPKTATVMVYGNCGSCEKTIEKAAFVKGEAKADWDQDTKMAVITFDSTKTNADAVLQRIAAAGYDSDKFKAPESAYTNLEECCQYERPKQAEAAIGAETPASDTQAPMVKKLAAAQKVEETMNPLAAVYASYFALKDALVATDGKTAAKQADMLSMAISSVKMEDLNEVQHPIWMKYLPKISGDAEFIKGSTNTEKQREHFATLSKSMYEIIKVVKPGTSVYYDHCPMYGDGKNGNWLSLDANIKNPYFGDKMLTCGSVKETL